MRLYQVAAVRVDEQGKPVEILRDVSSVLANDERSAEYIIVRELPDNIVVRDVRVIVVPFGKGH